MASPKKKAAKISQTFDGHIEVLHNFVNDVRNLPDSGMSLEAACDSLMPRYQELQALFQNLKPTDWKHFSDPDDVRLIEFLRLGQGNHESLKKVVNLMSQGADDPDLARVAVEYLKTNRAFAEIHSNKREMNEDDALRIFRTLFGVEATKNVVMSFRAEMLGCAVGYALSGLAKNDIHEWSEDKKLQKIYPNLSDYLFFKMQEEDKVLDVLRVDKGHEGVFAMTCAIKDNLNRGANGLQKARQGGHADHLFINRKTNPITITIGSSTSDDNLENQGKVFLKNYNALDLLTKQAEINGVPNEFFGAKILPYYFSTGLLPTGLDHEQAKGKHVEAAKKLRAVADQDSMNAIGQLALISILGNLSTKDDLFKFFAHNQIIVGTESGNLHDIHKEILARPEFLDGTVSLSDNSDKDAMNTKLRNFVLSHLRKTLQVFTKADMGELMADKTFFAKSCANLENVLNGLPHIFNETMTKAEWEKNFEVLRADVKSFQEKYGGAIFDNKTIARMGLALSNYEAFVAAQNATKPQSFIWNDPPKAKKSVETSTVRQGQIGPAVYFMKRLWSDIEGQEFNPNARDSIVRFINMVEAELSGTPLSQNEKTHEVSWKKVAAAAINRHDYWLKGDLALPEGSHPYIKRLKLQEITKAIKGIFYDDLPVGHTDPQKLKDLREACSPTKMKKYYPDLVDSKKRVAVKKS